MNVDQIKDWIIPILALASAMLLFERRLARVETRVEIILQWIKDRSEL